MKYLKQAVSIIALATGAITIYYIIDGIKKLPSIMLVTVTELDTQGDNKPREDG